MLLLIQGCKRNDRESQRLLYNQLYGYCISICLRYCRTHDEAKEVTNDGFMKVFQKIDQYKTDTSFKGWIRRIMINASIDHYRKERKHYYQVVVDDVSDHFITHATGLDELSHKELVAMIQCLSPGYRTVFNLYAIDGYTHEEIGVILGISVGASKSNLSKAREKLRGMLNKINADEYAKSV
ncbi:MAG: RNA polymerase sigma factor [Cyclobacteriaceae bacterium]|nr:RNA polymerase sigma factor [Cyclobacteriaceae bacterium]